MRYDQPGPVPFPGNDTPLDLGEEGLFPVINPPPTAGRQFDAQRGAQLCDVKVAIRTRPSTDLEVV